MQSDSSLSSLVDSIKFFFCWTVWRSFCIPTGHSPPCRFIAFCRTSTVSEHSKLWELVFASHTAMYWICVLRSTMCKITTVCPSVFIHHSHTSSFRVNYSVFWFSEAFFFESEPCGSRRKQPLQVPVRLTNRWKARTNTTCTHRKSGKPSFRLSPQSFRKVVRPPFDFLNFTQNKEAHKRTEGTPSFWRRHTIFKLQQKSEGSDRPTHSHYSLSLHFSQHIALLKSYSLSILRGRLQELGSRRCARNPQKKTCPHFLPSHRHRCCKQGFSGSHTSTHLLAQEKNHRPKGILLSHHVETDQHAFTVWAGMQGPKSTTFPRVQIRTNTSPQRFVSLSGTMPLSAGSHWKLRLPHLSPSPSLPPP